MERPSLYSLTLENHIADSEEIRVAAGENLDIIHTVLRIYGLSEDKLIHSTRYLSSAIQGFVSLKMSGGFG